MKLYIRWGSLSKMERISKEIEGLKKESSFCWEYEGKKEEIENILVVNRIKYVI